VPTLQAHTEGITLMKLYPTDTRWGKHTVKLTWQIDDFKAEGIFLLGGNCKGGSILESAIDSIEDGDFEPDMSYEENQKHFVVNGDGYLVEVKLFDKDGNETSFDADFFYDFLVGVEIIKFERDER
jgi:hypothetical protein